MSTKQRPYGGYLMMPSQPLSLREKYRVTAKSRDLWTNVATSPDLSLPATPAARNLARS
jgi:hypothetical protein